MIKRRSTLRSPQFAKKKKRELWIKSSVAVVVLLVVLVVPPLISHLSALTIRSIHIEGNEVVTKEELETYVRGKIAGNYLKVFSKSNIFLYPRRSTEIAMLRDFPRLQSADVFFKGFTSIGVLVEERKPFAVWCRDEEVLDADSASSNCYFMNRDGLIFTKAPTFSGNVYVRYHGLLEGGAAENPIFTQYVPAKQFQDLSEFIAQVDRLGFFITDATLSKDGDLELRTEAGGRVLSTTREPFLTTLEHLESLLNDRTSVPKPADFIANLDYLDLRFGKKLFFKVR